MSNHKGVQLFKTPPLSAKHSFMWQKHSFYVAKTLLLCGKNTPLGIEIPCCSRAEQALKGF